MAKKKGSKKMSASNIRYKTENRRMRNKIKKMEKTLKKHPNDLQTRASLDKWLAK